MRIENKIYFAPGIEFLDLDWNDPKNLVEPFRERVFGFYLNPAKHFARLANKPEVDRNLLPVFAFGCGVLCSTAIDFLAGVELFPSQKVGERYEDWLSKRIELFSKSDPDRPKQNLAARFYTDFRNGLIHEGRIKNAGQFSFDMELFSENGVVTIIDGAMIVNPDSLLDGVASALNAYLSEVSVDDFLLQKFRCTLINYFEKDMEYSKKQR